MADRASEISALAAEDRQIQASQRAFSTPGAAGDARGFTPADLAGIARQRQIRARIKELLDEQASTG